MSLPRYDPMLAVRWPQPFAHPDWTFEPKYDGIRGILSSGGGRTTLHTRTGREVSARFPELAGWGARQPVVLDGEVVVLSGPDKASFQRLQHRSGPPPAALDADPVSFIAFDLLHLGNEPLLDLPLEERRQRLVSLDLAGSVSVTDVFEDGEALWRRVEAEDLEGLVAKRRGSRYRPGARSPDWRKVANLHTVKALVGGFTAGEGGRRRTFGALVLGLWDGDRLRYAGSVGTGFSDDALEAIRGTLDRLRRSDSPFHADGEIPASATWVEPALVAAVTYRNWTSAGRVRHPVFKGFTDDAIEGVTWELEGPD